MHQVTRQLEDLGVIYRQNEPMSRHTTFKAGGAAKIFIEPKDENELLNVINILENAGIKYMTIGCGSNLLIRDGGYSGTIISMCALNSLKIVGDTLHAMAGARLSNTCMFALDNGLMGMEFAGGIPGSVGGGLFMNAGAYGGEMKDIVTGASVIREGRIIRLSSEQLDLGYRHSSIERDGGIITQVEMTLSRGDVGEARAKLKELNRRRKEKQPLEYPSAGSTFKRPEGHFAGALIEGAGLKGCRIGGACVSEKHAGFIVNDKNATADDIISLIEHVKQVVLDKYGVELTPEVRIIGD